MADEGQDRRFFSHVDKPEWGVGILVDERDGKRTIDWQHGKRHVIAEPFWSKLVERTPGAADERAIMAANESITRSLEPKKAKKARKGPAPVLPTWEGQLDRFRKKWPGGFQDAAYVAAERTAREGAVRAAAELFSGDATPEGPRIKELLQSSGLLHPVEIARLAGNGEWIAPMRELLAGGGDPLAAFDAVVAALGAKPTWTMATAIPALRFPDQHVFVKPGLFQTQARVLGRPIEGYSPTPAGAVYVQFVDATKQAAEKLRASGLPPRDLLDVHVFVWRTLSPVPKPTNGAGAAAVPAASVIEDDD
jgi:hypothetical protein